MSDKQYTDLDVIKSISSAYNSMRQAAQQPEPQAEELSDQSDAQEDSDLVESTKKEEKKLDPVGKEDGDVDNDGDTDASDKYLKARRKAISKSVAKEEVELDEANMSRVAKELEVYARKNGGIDKMDFMKAAVMMKNGQTSQLKKFVDELDTEPREKILSLMGKDADRRKEYKAYQKKMRGEEVEENFATKAMAGKSPLKKKYQAPKDGEPDRASRLKKKMYGSMMGGLKKEEVELDEAMKVGKKGLSRKDVKSGTYVIKANPKNMDFFPRLADVQFQKLGFDFNHSPEKLEKGITQKDGELEVTIKLNRSPRPAVIRGKTVPQYKDATITVKKLKESVDLEEGYSEFKSFKAQIQKAKKGDCPKIMKDIEKAFKSKKIDANEYDELTAMGGRKMDQLGG
jgi:hypothetical protein